MIELHRLMTQLVIHNQELFAENRLVFFANDRSTENVNTQEPGQSEEPSDQEENTEDDEDEDQEIDQMELLEKKVPKLPRDTAKEKKWKEYEKEVSKMIRAYEAEKTENGQLTTKQQKRYRELRNNRSYAQRMIRRRERELEQATAAEFGGGFPEMFQPISTDRVVDADNEHHTISRIMNQDADELFKKRMEVHRFLKNSVLLVSAEERERGLRENIFTDWERAVLELSDLDQEMETYLRGRKFYVGSEKRENELHMKSDLIAKLESDLDEDMERFENEKTHYSAEEQAEKKKDFKARQKRIQELRKLKEREMLQQINAHIDKLERERRKKKLKVMEKMFTEFERRVARLIEEWQNPPDEYKYNKEKSLTLLGNMKDFLAQFKGKALEKNPLKRHKVLLKEDQINDLLDEDLKAMREFDIQLDNCEMRSNAKVEDLENGNEVIPDFEELEKIHQEWQERFPGVMEAAGEINGNQSDILSSLNNVKKILRETPLEDFNGDEKEMQEHDRNVRISMVDDNIEKIKSNSMDPKYLQTHFQAADKRLAALKDEIAHGDPNEVGIKERKRTFKQAIDHSNDYFDSIVDFKNNMEHLKKSIEEFGERKDLMTAQKAESNSIKVSVRWMTGQDMVRIWEHFKEWSKRRWERRSDDRVGEVGSNLFEIPGLSISKSLANEFDKIKEQSEINEVQQYKDAYSNKDSWQVMDVLENTKNVDEFKACLFLLSENGRLRFDNPKLWKQLEFFQRTINIVPSYDKYEIVKMKNSPMELHDRIHKAMGYIWDFDTYYELKNGQDSAYESKKGDWQKRCDQLSEVEGGLSKRASEILSEYKRDMRNGVTSKVNPHEYEAVIEYCIQMGKMGAEDKLYFLIQGLATGLLEYPDRLIYFNSKHLNIYPILESFTGDTGRGTSKPTWDDIENWAKLDYENNMPGQEFKSWYWTWAAHKPRAQQRTDKTLTQGSNRMDHDDVTGAVAFGSATTIKSMLRRSYGGDYGLPVTGFANTTVAYLQYLDNWALNANDIEQATSNLRRFIHAFTMFDGITRRKIFTKQDFFKFSDHDLFDPKGPRAAGGYETNAGKARAGTVNEHMNLTKELITSIDKPMFDVLYDDELGRDRNKLKNAIVWIKQYLKDPNIFDGVDPKDYNELIEVGFPKILKKLIEGPGGKERIAKMVQAVKRNISNKLGDRALKNLKQISDEIKYEQPDLARIRKENADRLPAK